MTAGTTDKEPFAVPQDLQRAGVPAGVCQTARDRIGRNPQLRHLQWLIPLPHRAIGPWPVKEVPVHFPTATVTQGGPSERAAPCYGEDRDYVYGALLQLSHAERAALVKEGVI